MYNGDDMEGTAEDTNSVNEEPTAPIPDEKRNLSPSYPVSGGSNGEEKRDRKERLEADIPRDELGSSGSSTAAYHSPSGVPMNSAGTAAQRSDEDLPGAPADPNAPTSTAVAPPKLKHHFRDAELTQDLLLSVHADPKSEGAAHARHLNGFFSVLALCHTVLTSVDPVTGKLEYKAQSPDEAALVQAAADMGYVFKGREREVLYLQTPFQTAGSVDGSEDELGYRRSIDKSDNGASGSGDPGTADGTLERYELLNILEFTSARKRMSVVLRKLDSDDGRLFLLSKGADNVIFERLREGANEDLKATTERHLDEFASQGLRTLTLAYRVVGGTYLLFFCQCVGSFFLLQRMNIRHGANDIMSPPWHWTTVKQRSRRFLTNSREI